MITNTNFVSVLIFEYAEATRARVLLVCYIVDDDFYKENIFSIVSRHRAKSMQ
jgi:hypothetical protein